MLQIPFGTALVAEFRGLEREAFAFTNDEGAKVDAPAKYRFEVENAKGEVVTLAFSTRQLDDAASFDVAKLKKGDLVALQGEVRDGQRGAYANVHRAERVDADGRVVKGA